MTATAEPPRADERRRRARGPPSRRSSSSSPPTSATRLATMPATTRVAVHRALAARSGSSTPATRIRTSCAPPPRPSPTAVGLAERPLGDRLAERRPHARAVARPGHPRGDRRPRRRRAAGRARLRVRLRRRSPRGALRPRHRGRRSGPTRAGLAFDRTACVNDDPAVMAALARRVTGSVDARHDRAARRRRRRRHHRARRGARPARPRPTPPRSSLLEADDRLGGKIRTSPFAGLARRRRRRRRVPRPRAVGHRARPRGRPRRRAHLAASAARRRVWCDGLHAIPEGLVLGMPTDVVGLARSQLLTWPGKLRAATEPFRRARRSPTTRSARYVRARFGDEVHERLVDPLVGSIYAADTDRFSLAAVPQIAELAARIAQPAARRARKRPPGARRTGLLRPDRRHRRAGRHALADEAAAARRRRSAPATPVTELAADGAGGASTASAVDAVVLALPGRPQRRGCSARTASRRPTPALGARRHRHRRRRPRHAGRRRRRRGPSDSPATAATSCPSRGSAW